MNRLLSIRSPLTHQAEREYIFKVIFGEFLGVEISLLFEQRTDIEISHRATSGRKLIIADSFLQTSCMLWLTKDSLPKTPLDSFEHDRFGVLPILFGKKSSNGAVFKECPVAVYCELDIFGSAFFMLSRYEEYVITERDSHNRFLPQHSIAYQENFLNRPLINEYIEILWEMMLSLWPSVQRMPRISKFLLSHDVDWPYYVVGKTAMQKLKEIMADILKRGNLDSAFKKAKAMWTTRSGDLSEDPFNTFRWIMEQSEKAGIRSAFYFITQETARGLDGNYSIYEPQIQQLLCEIHARGHEIGLHPSYHTYTNSKSIKEQFEILLDVTQMNGIHQETWGGRQHYLRWQTSETWQYWEEAGLDYDSTLGYAGLPGFRCGVCYEYSVFNLATRKHLKLKERPLIVMEQAVLSSSCMDLKAQEALKEIRNFYQQCIRFNGEFTLLWHNSQLVNAGDVTLYEDCINLLQN